MAFRVRNSGVDCVQSSGAAVGEWCINNCEKRRVSCHSALGGFALHNKDARCGYLGAKGT